MGHRRLDHRPRPPEQSLTPTVDPPALIRRFTPGSRRLHWVHAIPYLVLLLTGIALLLPQSKGLAVGGSRLLPSIHIAFGFLFIVSPIFTYLGVRDRRLVHRDVRRLLSAGRDDVRWLRWAALTAVGFRLHEPPSAKFNAGQKLNTLYTAATGTGLAVTGLLLTVHAYRKGVLDVTVAQQLFRAHDVLMFLASPVVAIHIYLAVANPATRESLRGILHGEVRRDWARRHHPRWVDDEDGRGLP